MEFNGWESWDVWNVALWLNNDQVMYDTAQRAIKLNPDVNVAAAAIQLELGVETPDGATINFSNIKSAIADDHADFWDV